MANKAQLDTSFAEFICNNIGTDYNTCVWPEQFIWKVLL